MTITPSSTVTNNRSSHDAVKPDVPLLVGSVVTRELLDDRAISDARPRHVQALVAGHGGNDVEAVADVGDSPPLVESTVTGELL
jgi:hypothetical protein